MAETRATFRPIAELYDLLHSFHMLSTEVGSEDQAVPWKTARDPQLTA